MRTLSFAILAALGLAAAPVQAADLGYDFLRGTDYGEPAFVSTPLIDWSGAYVGAHGGYSNAAMGFRNVFQSLVYSESRLTSGEENFGASTLLNPPARRSRGGSFGGYAGYNVQYGDFVFGLEGDYTWLDRTGLSGDALARVKSINDGMLERIALSGVSATRIADYGTIRARLGYAYGNFLPYVTGGVAIGRMQITDSVAYRNYGYNLATYNANQALTPDKNPAYVTNFGYTAFSQGSPESSFPYTWNIARHRSKVVGGIALGAGLEYAVTQNIILRGEYQYVLLDDFAGHKSNINTVRGGAAVKF